MQTMNMRDFLEELSRQLDRIHAHPLLAAELLDLMRKAGCEQLFLSILTNRLDFLHEHGRNAVQYSNKFERLNKDICSMHVDTKDKNIRILYSINDDGTVLLLAFHERGGKKATDYSKKIPEATRRLRELER